jgi:hypothetical protein
VAETKNSMKKHRPYYVLFVRQPGSDCYENEAGGHDLVAIRARASRAIMRGAASAWITQFVDVVQPPRGIRGIMRQAAKKALVPRG